MIRKSGKAHVLMPGFEHIERHWDPIHWAQVVKIFPGQFYVTNQDEILVTTLGSCISACIRDPQNGVGGMNHFMLPSKTQNRDSELSDSPWNIAARYGNLAMELLINAIMRNGGKRENLEIKLFGGAKILSRMRDIGTLNIDFIRKYVHTEGLSVLAEDLGGNQPRKIMYYPATGKARMKQLQRLTRVAVARSERHYRSDLNRGQQCGEVELFNDPD
jgi:chemotaxis protein CheD